MMPIRRNATTAAAAGRSVRRPRGFSLIELMIAIVLLGLGMIMVATMFPAAWSRARQLTEFSNHATATAAAEAAVVQLAGVDDDAPVRMFGGNRYASDRISFQGDQFMLSKLMAVPPPPPLDIWRNASPRVFPLHLANILADEPRGFVNEDPWRLDPIEHVVLEPQYATVFPPSAYVWPQVRFRDRVYPPMRKRENVLSGGLFAPDAQDEQWDTTLDTRRFCWAVFHKLDSAYVDRVNLQGGRLIGETRPFKMYYFTLRRGQSTHRFARQDPDPSYVPDPDFTDVPMEQITALPAEKDVLFPVPWRVQVLLPEELFFADPPVVPSIDPSGVPTVITAGVTLDLPTSGFVAQLFRRGSVMIDERSGEIYRVEKYRDNAAALPADLLVHLTLDRQVLGEEVGTNLPLVPGFQVLEDRERLRTVWVFPPNVVRDPIQAGLPTFGSSQPVIGLDVRDQAVSP